MSLGSYSPTSNASGFGCKASACAVSIYRVPVAVKSRVFINVFNEQPGGFFTPGFEGLDGCLMLQGALWDAVIVGFEVER